MAGAGCGDATGPLNRAFMKVERSLLVGRGLPGRFWYAHQLYAPELHDGFTVETLPGVRDALFREEDLDSAERYVSDLLDSLREATAIFGETVP